MIEEDDNDDNNPKSKEEIIFDRLVNELMCVLHDEPLGSGLRALNAVTAITICSNIKMNINKEIENYCVCLRGAVNHIMEVRMK